jgi:hypothetical protein
MLIRLTRYRPTRAVAGTEDGTSSWLEFESCKFSRANFSTAGNKWGIILWLAATAALVRPLLSSFSLSLSRLGMNVLLLFFSFMMSKGDITGEELKEKERAKRHILLPKFSLFFQISTVFPPSRYVFLPSFLPSIHLSTIILSQHQHQLATVKLRGMLENLTSPSYLTPRLILVGQLVE